MWGFTKKMRETEPFGLPDSELRPGKVVADPVHGDVGLTRLEMRVVNSRPFQRLRRVRQLGSTHLVYPGATHTRFSHSLGTVRTVQLLLDFAIAQREGLHPAPDLFEQWVRDDVYHQELARATVLARLGGLLHDLCHIPFGHSIEDEMGILEPHDKNAWRLEELWRRFDPELKDMLASEGLDEALKHVIAPEAMPPNEVVESYLFVKDLVGNTICGDLVDYLARDHLFAGLPIGLGQRFLSALFVTPDGENEFYRRRMALSITRDGRERADVVTELLKYLRYRYELTERVLVHHAKLRADAMVGKLLQLWREEVAQVEQEEAWRTIEMELLKRGDDGLLEYLASFGNAETGGTTRRKTIAMLASELLERRLFPLAGRCSAKQAPAAELRERYKEPDTRQELERELAEYAELEAWQVAIWLPPEEMGLKEAKVLVYDGSSVAPFDRSEAQGRKRGAELDDLHRALWAISVFVHESVAAEQREEILVRLAQRSGIRWDRLRDRYGPNTELWPDELAARRIAEEWDDLPEDAANLLLGEIEMIPTRTQGGASPQTFAAVKGRLEEVANSLWRKPSPD
jgi:uncharacterized protein